MEISRQMEILEKKVDVINCALELQSIMRNVINKPTVTNIVALHIAHHELNCGLRDHVVSVELSELSRRSDNLLTRILNVFGDRNRDVGCMIEDYRNNHFVVKRSEMYLSCVEKRFLHMKDNTGMYNPESRKICHTMKSAKAKMTATIDHIAEIIPEYLDLSDFVTMEDDYKMMINTANFCSNFLDDVNKSIETDDDRSRKLKEKIGEIRISIDLGFVRFFAGVRRIKEKYHRDTMIVRYDEIELFSAKTHSRKSTILDKKRKKKNRKVGQNSNKIVETGFLFKGFAMSTEEELIESGVESVSVDEDEDFYTTHLLKDKKLWRKLIHDTNIDHWDEDSDVHNSDDEVIETEQYNFNPNIVIHEPTVGSQCTTCGLSRLLNLCTCRRRSPIMVRYEMVYRRYMLVMFRRMRDRIIYNGVFPAMRKRLIRRELLQYPALREDLDILFSEEHDYDLLDCKGRIIHEIGDVACKVESMQKRILYHNALRKWFEVMKAAKLTP